MCFTISITKQSLKSQHYVISDIKPCINLMSLSSAAGCWLTSCTHCFGSRLSSSPLFPAEGASFTGVLEGEMKPWFILHLVPTPLHILCVSPKKWWLLSSLVNKSLFIALRDVSIALSCLRIEKNRKMGIFPPPMTEIPVGRIQCFWSVWSNSNAVRTPGCWITAHHVTLLRCVVNVCSSVEQNTEDVTVLFNA